ncbi:MAG TPA: vanadium-dependent haloperoxidase [Terriglobales bacterium]|nr:vanadium-dependent haloperoxidase [Terriglobales bacterium]
MKTSCEIGKSGSQTCPWRVLWPFALFLTLNAAACAQDVVTEWNLNAEKAILATPTVSGSGAAAARVYVLMHVAIFDAVNGIERHYAPYHVDAAAPRGASRRAAVIAAAYNSLVVLFPSQKSTLDAELSLSLASLAADDEDPGDSQSIDRGLAWGQQVANDIQAWRSNDGFNTVLPPVIGGLAPGQWRPTPPAFQPMATPQLATMLPYAIESPSQFRPAGPPALNSAQYAADFDETKNLGSATSSSRTAEQTLIANYWAGNSSISWNRVASSLAIARHTTLSENVRLFALMNLAVGDASIAGWDSKLHFMSWRPVTAIPLADSLNPDTVADPNWKPLLVTPRHPEYVSAHAIFSSAATGVLAAYFGDDTTFSLESVSLPGVFRTYNSFSSALDEITLARIYAGFHFRSACVDGRSMGTAIAQYVLDNVAQPNHGERRGQVSHDHPEGQSLSIENAGVDN